MKKQTRNPNRRDFLAGVGAAAVGAFTIVKSGSVRGTQAGAKVKLGLLGCGGRGTWIARLFMRHGGYEMAAAYDYFKDRTDAFGSEFNIPAANRFNGLYGYNRLLERGGVDAIAIESPPYFHPEQAAAGVDAGKHVYLAKPIAVDVPGCRSVSDSAKKATAKKLCFLVDFQTRANAAFIEAIRRVHEGAIGEFSFGEASYHAGVPWTKHFQYLETKPVTAETWLRAWGLSRSLSGDIITEQNIHTLDVMSWIMKRPPLHAVGTGNQKVRLIGESWDHFSVIFQYADGVDVSFDSRQFEGHGSVPEGIRNRMFGTKGVLETEYGGQVLIRGANFYNGGKTSGIYEEGAVNNIAAFYNAVQKGDATNPTVEPSVQSNLVTILGRNAAYEKRLVTWTELENDDKRLVPDLKGLKD